MDYKEEQFDGLFLNILQQAKGIDNFFECLFSCLRRKSDFFTQGIGLLNLRHFSKSSRREIS